MHNILIYLVSASHVSGLYYSYLQESRVQIGSWLLSAEYDVCLRAAVLLYPGPEADTILRGQQTTADLNTCILKMELI
jgi:hypothetical protein